MTVIEPGLQGTGRRKQEVNLAICGHAWHGKSTLVGKCVAETGMIGHRELHQYSQLAKKGRDASLIFALLVFRQKDVFHEQEEGARGITILPSYVRFEFPTHLVTVVDTPGQEHYTNNRFSGLFSADAALLIVDVTDGVAPITRQVMRILKGYEVPLRAVAVTKMDLVDYDEAAFRRVEQAVRGELKAHEIDDRDVQFLPTSAWATGRDLAEPGEGITRFTKMPWWDGPTFHSFMAGLSFKVVRPQRPLRIAISASDIYDQVPGVGKAFTGLVEAGALRREQALRFEPLSAMRGEPVTAVVRSVELTKGHIATPGVPIDEAIPRMLVGVAVRNVSPKEKLRELFQAHGVLAGPVDEPPSVARELECEFTVFDPEMKLQVGQEWTLHAHFDHVNVQILGIDARRDEQGGAWVEEAAQSLVAGEWGRLRFAAVRPLAIEESAKLGPLSRVVLRKENRPLGYGRCLRILK